MLFLVTGVAMAQEVETVMLPRDDSQNCNVSASFIESAKATINEWMNLSPYSFSNLTSSYCYTNSVNLRFIFKKSESSIIGKSVSASFYSSDVFDYDLIFTSKENEVIGYSLKQKYVDYLINGTDEEYYARLSPTDNKCDELRTYYGTLSGEKYFNDEGSYCSIVTKTKTSELKNLVDDSVNYINYFGDTVRYTFSGWSEGSYDLAALAASLDCDLSKSNYYYPEFESDCYGIYKDKSRVYFSASSNNSYLNFYGIIGGKARITANAYGEGIDETEAQAWVDSILSKYFSGQSLELKSNKGSYPTLTATKVVSSFTFSTNSLSDLKVTKDQMNTYYSNDNIYVTISEPFIQVYVPEDSTTETLSIMPYYWGRNFVITGNKIYSSINLEENNEALAVEKINEFINPYITTTDWELNMTVTGQWYMPYPIGYRGVVLEDGLAEAGVSQATGVQDSFSQEFPEFEELEEEEPVGLLQGIINFFKGLFGLS